MKYRPKLHKKNYLINAENVYLTTNSGNHKPAEKNWFRKTVKAGMVILTIYQIMANPFLSTEFIISTSIIIYWDFPAVQSQLIKIVEIYLRL